MTEPLDCPFCSYSITDEDKYRFHILEAHKEHLKQLERDGISPEEIDAILGLTNGNQLDEETPGTKVHKPVSGLEMRRGFAPGRSVSRRKRNHRNTWGVARSIQYFKN